MGRRLAEVEQALDLFGGVFGEQGYTQGRSGEMPGPIAAFGERFEYGPLGDGNEIPGLAVLRGLGAAAVVEDGEDGFLGQGSGGKFADGALETDGVADTLRGVRGDQLSGMARNPGSRK